MTASVLARPEGGAPNERASQKARGPVGPNLRTPGRRPGDVVRLSGQDSPQFALQPILLRIVRTEAASTSDEWEWLDGYQLDAVGEAVAKRRVFVRAIPDYAAWAASIPAPRGES